MEPLLFPTLSYSNSCRICLQSKPEMTSIFQIRDSVNIYEKVMYCSDIIILKGDNYPDCICDDCLRELDIASRFKQKSEESDKILKQHITHSVIHENGPVKQEYYDNDIPLDHNSTDNSGCEDDVKPLQYLDRKQEKHRTKFKIRKKLSVQKKVRSSQEYLAMSKKYVGNDTVKESNIKNSDDRLSYNNCNEDVKFDSHQSISKSPSKVKKLKKKTVKRQETDELKCETCNLLCQNKWVLKVHMRTHSGERPFQCELCLKRFVSNSNMRMHKRLTHDDNKQVCSECGKSFSCLTYLKRHLVIHFDVKPYGCTICQKRFTTKSYLKEHIARHRGDKRFFCEICGSKFISVVNLKQHMLVHGVQKRDFKRHQCTFCDYKTTGKVDLARHIRKHTGEKPFRCPHDGCQSAFSGKASLNLHIRIHTGEKPYLCSECPARFSRGDKFKNHMLKKHNITDVGPSKRSKLVIRELAEAAERGSLLPVPMDILKITNDTFSTM